MDYSWLEVIKKSIDSLEKLASELRAASTEESVNDSELRMAIGEIEENTSRVSRLLSLEKNRVIFSKYHITPHELYLLTPDIDDNTRKALLRGNSEVFTSVAKRLLEATNLWRERIINPSEMETPDLAQEGKKQFQKYEPIHDVKTILLLGAGASRSLQIPMMADFWQIVLDNSHSPEEKLALKMLFDTAKDETIHLPPDLEKLLGMLNRYNDYFTILWEDPLFGFPSHSLQYTLPFQPLLPWSREKPQGRFLRNCGHASIGISRIEDNIKKIMDAAYTQKLNQADVISLYHPLFSYLNNHFRLSNITLFTTNYDTAIEQYCRYLGIELIDGFQKIGANLVWNPEMYYQEPKLDQNIITLFKLHGSLTWRKIGNEIIEFGMSSRNMPGDTALIYPTETKEYPYEEPFKTAYKFLDRLLKTAEIAIVIGYSFRDRGITYIIDEAQSVNPNLKFIIICGENVEDDTRKRFPYGSQVIEHDFKLGENAEYLMRLSELFNDNI